MDYSCALSILTKLISEYELECENIVIARVTIESLLSDNKDMIDRLNDKLKTKKCDIINMKASIVLIEAKAKTSASDTDTSSLENSAAGSLENSAAGSSRNSAAGSLENSAAGSSRNSAAGSSRNSAAKTSEITDAKTSEITDAKTSEITDAKTSEISAADSSKNSAAGSSRNSAAGSSRNSAAGSSEEDKIKTMTRWGSEMSEEDRYPSLSNSGLDYYAAAIEGMMQPDRPKSQTPPKSKAFHLKRQTFDKPFAYGKDLSAASLKDIQKCSRNKEMGAEFVFLNSSEEDVCIVARNNLDYNKETTSVEEYKWETDIFKEFTYKRTPKEDERVLQKIQYAIASIYPILKGNPKKLVVVVISDSNNEYFDKKYDFYHIFTEEGRDGYYFITQDDIDYYKDWRSEMKFIF
jgi:hypothetical protein